MEYPKELHKNHNDVYTFTYPLVTFRCILCDVYSTHVFTIIHVNTFHESKGGFPVLVL